MKGYVLSKLDKAIQRLKTKPKDYTYSEARQLLGQLGFNEYNKGGRGVWGQYPSAMIVKVAETMALKRAFSISGLVTEEEIGDGDVVKESTEQKETELRRKEAIRNLWNGYFKICGNDARLVMGEITGKNSSSEYTDEDISKLAIRLDEIIAQQSSENSGNAAIDVEEVNTEEASNEE